jgi:transposase-like protein
MKRVITFERRESMKWKDLKGEERYRVVEMARKGQVPIKELCRTFGVSRQTLKIAMEKVDQAAMEALEPKSPGRKARSLEESQVSKVMEENAALRKDLDQWKQKYEIAITFVDLHRKYLSGEELPGEEEEPKKQWKKKKRRRLRNPKPAKMSGTERTEAQMDTKDDG